MNRIAAAARECGLVVMASLHPRNDDDLPAGCQTLVMLGPDGGAFWARFVASAEYRDGTPDPMDRWSARVIGALAATMGAEAVFPFGGPPFRPFVRWALESGWAHSSPVSLLVHPHAGMFLSFRGALAFGARLALPPPPPSPCATCVGRPCLDACPVGALTGSGYDVPACREFLGRDAGRDCMDQGCAVRRACPISARHGRMAEQSAFHMRYFQ